MPLSALPCPFCNAAPKESEHGKIYMVGCQNPRCLVNPVTNGRPTLSLALMDWNKRTRSFSAEEFNLIGRLAATESQALQEKILSFPEGYEGSELRDLISSRDMCEAIARKARAL